MSIPSNDVADDVVYDKERELKVMDCIVLTEDGEEKGVGHDGEKSEDVEKGGYEDGDEEREETEGVAKEEAKKELNDDVRGGGEINQGKEKAEDGGEKGGEENDDDSSEDGESSSEEEPTYDEFQRIIEDARTCSDKPRARRNIPQRELPIRLRELFHREVNR